MSVRISPGDRAAMAQRPAHSRLFEVALADVLFVLSNRRGQLIRYLESTVIDLNRRLKQLLPLHLAVSLVQRLPPTHFTRYAHSQTAKYRAVGAMVFEDLRVPSRRQSLSHVDVLPVAIVVD